MACLLIAAGLVLVSFTTPQPRGGRCTRPAAAFVLLGTLAAARAMRPSAKAPSKARAPRKGRRLARLT
jgi:hypothetical protein